MHKRILIHKLFDIGAVRFGSFTLKSGQVSPIYIDLRRAFSYPKILVLMGEALHAEMQGSNYDLICPVPYAAIPMATAISIQHSIPMIFLRKETKEYGTKKLIEGVYEKGQKVLVVEDVITSGRSILESIEPLEKEGLIVQDIAVFMNREQGGMQMLENKGYRPRAVCSMKELICLLLEEKLIETDTAEKVYAFIDSPKMA